jgi:hypothetical protein
MSLTSYEQASADKILRSLKRELLWTYGPALFCGFSLGMPVGMVIALLVWTWSL